MLSDGCAEFAFLGVIEIEFSKASVNVRFSFAQVRTFNDLGDKHGYWI
jgi:hypothetical protein